SGQPRSWLHRHLPHHALASSVRDRDWVRVRHRRLRQAANLRRMSSEVSGNPGIPADPGDEAGSPRPEATGPATPPEPRPTAGKIAILRQRRDEAVHAGSARAVETQHAKGKMTARERIERLLDPGSFTELDELARHRATDFGVEANR